jgi:hypothetical protein
MQGWTRKDEVVWASSHLYGGHTGVLDSNVPFAVFTGILPFVLLAETSDFWPPRFYPNDVSLALYTTTAPATYPRSDIALVCLSFLYNPFTFTFFLALPDLDVSRLLASGVNTCK